MHIALMALLIAGLLGGGYYVYTTNEASAPTEVNEEVNTTSNTTTGMRVEENAVVTPEQRPGTTVTVAQVYLAAPGYVVIHEDNKGEAGTILGSSALLQAGENNDIKVTLSRSSKDGEKLWAMLHTEANDNGKFDPSADTPVESRLGGALSGWFEIKADASTDVQISL